jgi:hypothetical protein
MLDADRFRRRFLLLALAGVLSVAAAVAYRWLPRPDNLAAVRQRVEALEQEADRARDNPHHDYAPRVLGSISDLNAPAVEILRHLPGVVHVETRVACAKPTHRIIHFRDWHFVPGELFAEDLADSFGRPPTDEEAELYHRKLLLQVAPVERGRPRNPKR